MNNQQVTIVIPVGPHPSNVQWLRECLNSVLAQTVRPHVILIDDGANVDELDYIETIIYHPALLRSGSYDVGNDKLEMLVYTPPWHCGISHAFNYGVGLSGTELVFMLGSDDTLEPRCIEKCLAAYEVAGRKDAYYSVPIKYKDTGEVQTAPCNAAMVTKKFWEYTGGFPIETAMGGGDTVFLSICLRHNLPVYMVGYVLDEPEMHLYNYRRHPDIHTYKLNWGLLDPLRNILTQNWTPNVHNT